MSNNVLTLALEGDIALEDFANAIGNLNLLLNQLSEEVASGTVITWLIDELYAGSAVATFRGINEDVKSVESVVDAYEEVGDSLQSGRRIPYSANVQKYTYALMNVLNGRVTSVRFETPTKDIVIVNKPQEGEPTTQIKYGWSAVKGKVETISRRRKLHFTLWDLLYDKPVSCYSNEGQEDIMRDAWGKGAIVSGRVGRRTETGRPVVIRDIKQVRLLKDVKPGSFRQARGVIPWSIGDELPEEIVERLRSA